MGNTGVTPDKDPDMNKHKLISFRVIVILLFVSALLVPGQRQAQGGGAQAKWTYMVYMAGDNNLEHWLVQDIAKEFGRVGSSKDVNIVLLSDRIPGYTNQEGDWTDTRIFYVEKGDTAASTPVANWGERNTGDPQTLIDFVKYAKQNYKAAHYVLILWGHSWAWRPEQTMWDSSTPYDPNNIDIWAENGAAAGSLDPHEITQILDSGKLGPLDIIAYDACEEQVIEVEAVWQGHAKYMVASQDDVWWEGFRNDLILSALVENPDMSSEALANLMGQSMTDRTIAVVDLAGIGNLLTTVDEWSAALSAGLANHRSEYDIAYNNTLGVDGDPLNKDLYDAANEVMQAVNDPVIQAKSQAVMNAVSNVVVYEWHQKAKYKDAHGIGIFWPRYPQDLDLPSPHTYGYDWYYYYFDGSSRPGLKFSQQTGWDDFLNAYVIR
jgi:Clostripain family